MRPDWRRQLIALGIGACTWSGLGASQKVNTNNLLRNGSFEAGWANEIGRQQLVNDPAFPDASWLSREHAYHGKTSLKLSKIKPLYATTKGMVCYTIPLSLKKAGLYRASLWARAFKGKQKVVLRAMWPHTSEMTGPNRGVSPHPIKDTRIEAMVGTNWQQLQIEIPASPGKAVYLEFTGEDIYVDAIEVIHQGATSATEVSTDEGVDDDLGDLELGEDEGGSPSKVSFQASAPVECTVSDRVSGHIHYGESGADLILGLYNHTDKASKVKLEYELMNQDRKIVRRDRLDIHVKPGVLQERPWRLKDIPNGKYSLKYWIKGHEKAWGEFVFLVMPKPVKGLISPSGVLTFLSPQMAAIMKRAGINYYNSLVDSIRIRDNYDFETKKLEDRSFILDYGKREDLTMSMCLNVSWWKKKSNYSRDEILPSRHPSADPDIPSLLDAARQAVKIYGPYTDIWYLQDELEGHIHPHQFVKPYLAVRNEIKKLNPKAEFWISATGAWYEQFDRSGGFDAVDIIGGSTMNFRGNQGLKLGWLARKHKKRYWATAGAFTTYSPFSRLRGGKVHGRWSLHRSIISSVFLHQAFATSMYRAALNSYDWSMVHDPFNVMEADNSPGIGLSLYVIAGQILAGAKTDMEPLEVKADHGGLVWGFDDGRSKSPAACLFPGRKRTLKIGVSLDKVEIRDRLYNLLPLEEVSGGSSIALEADRFYFVYAKGLSKDKFTQLMIDAETERRLGQPEDIDVVSYYTMGPDKNLKITKAYVNRTSKEQRFDARRFGRFRKSLPAKGIEKVVEDSPYSYREGLPMRSLHQPTGSLWLATAAKLDKTPKLDGDLSEWQPEIASTLFMSEEVLGDTEDGDIHAHKKAYKIYCDYGMDYRLEWFAAHDKNHFYFNARVYDDQLVTASDPKGGKSPDQIELVFYHPLSDELLLDPTKLERARVKLVTTGDSNKPGIQVLTGTSGTSSRAAIKMWDDPKMLDAWKPWKHPGPHVGYTIEAAIPWKDLGIKPKDGMLLNFDVFGHETDTHEELVEASVLRWAGKSNPAGQLRLGQSTKKLVPPELQVTQSQTR